MPLSASQALRELDRRKTEFGEGVAEHKRRLLSILARARLNRAADVLWLHETLCFMRAYPDDERLLTQVERMLAGFAKRVDLRRFRETLESTGVAGADMLFSFFAPTALWLAKRWPQNVVIEWDLFERSEALGKLVPLLALYGETPAVDEFGFDAREWLERMKGPNETDAAFLLRRLEQLPIDVRAREIALDELDIPLRLKPGKRTPARTNEKYTGAGRHGQAKRGHAAPVAYQRTPLRHARPAQSEIATRRAQSIRALPSNDGIEVIELARTAMATRCRDLDAFAYADAHDVSVVDCGDGLQLAFIGVTPDRRLMLETMYGYLMLKNGVPVGYGTATALFSSAEVAYTVFDTFRSGEAAEMYVWVLAAVRRLIDVDTFMIAPYQLGQDNDDAIRSGAWWFYRKLGFEPRDREVRRIMQREQRRMKQRPQHRSSAATLKQLASVNVYLHLNEQRDDVLGVLPLANVGLCITDYLAKRFGYDRSRAERECAREAAARLNVRSISGWTPDQKRAWRNWSPLVLILPGVNRWTPRDKRDLVATIRSKGNPSESDYLKRFDAHRKLRVALVQLAEYI